MEKVLLLLHTETDGSLSKPALESVRVAATLAQELPGSTFAVGLVGEAVQSAADTIASCGATRFLAVAGPDYAQARYSTDALAVQSICAAFSPTLVIAPATSRWNRVLPGAAHRVGGRAETHVASANVINGSVTVNRWYYRQRMEAELTRNHRPWFILMDPGSQPPWTGQRGVATVEALQTAPASAPRTTVTGFRELAGDAKTIRPEAQLLFVAGAGWTKKQADGQTHAGEAEKLIAECLRLSRASLGSTKSLVDLGGEGQAVLSFLTHFNQVGQTGSTPRHPKGLATCCHGEEPHTVGWRFINERRAVNLDPNCGWARGKADVLYVADAFAVIAKVNELLSSQG